eukprot:scaffold31183_cov51-Phaeocystis_antarctica.AAC.3
MGLRCECESVHLWAHHLEPAVSIYTYIIHEGEITLKIKPLPLVYVWGGGSTATGSTTRSSSWSCSGGLLCLPPHPVTFCCDFVSGNRNCARSPSAGRQVRLRRPT